jgi:serine protease AprX
MMKAIKIFFKEIIILLLLISLTSPGLTPFQIQSVPRVSPIILRLAGDESNRPLQLIVQKADTTKQVENLVVQLGGKIIKDLHIINAIVVNLPAGAARQLGNSPSVKWVSLDSQISQSDGEISDGSQPFDFVTPSPTDGTLVTMSPDGTTPLVLDSSTTSISTASTYNGFFPFNTYSFSIKANGLYYEQLWGQGITVAIVDSGIDASQPDLRDARGNPRVIASQNFSQSDNSQNDQYGHGTHVAGIIGGNGSKYRGIYAGIALKAKFVDVKVTDAEGKGNESDVISGLQWIYDNKNQYNIRVVNLSLNSSSPQPYQTSPLDAALEVLWFNQIVVVVSAGNNGSGQNNGILYPPANDPFVITVGAVNDQHTVSTRDDTLASYSAYGLTESGFNKPDIVAPGANIISLLANLKTTIAIKYPDHIITPYYFRMSGTSMASAVTTGAVALLLQSNPSLNPDQVKFRLMSTAKPFGPNTGAGYLDIYSAVHSPDMSTANTGLPISQLISFGENQNISGSVMWNSVMWNSVMWNSVMWNSVMWNSVMWNSDYWGE